VIWEKLPFSLGGEGLTLPTERSEFARLELSYKSSSN